MPNYIHYAGWLIEQKGKNFFVLKHSFKSLNEAKIFIDKSFLNI